MSGSKMIRGSYIPFVVRQDAHKLGSDLLFKTSDLTWVAYNKFGGYNLYRGNGSFAPASRALKASYSRPWQNRLPKPEGHQSNFLFGAEFSMIFWLEKHGYDVSYCSCADIEMYHKHNQLRPETFRVILSVGHDEYWTPGMKLAHESARDSGVHLAFFSGNEVFWRVIWNEHLDIEVHSAENKRLHGSYMSDYRTNATFKLGSRTVMVCSKPTLDEHPPLSSKANEWTGTFRDSRFRSAEDESLLTGQWFAVNGERHDAITVSRSDSVLRIWRNASFEKSLLPPKYIEFRFESNSNKSSSQRDYMLNTFSFLDENVQLGFLRETEIIYKSPSGVLGYEWDVFPDPTSPNGPELRGPPGLFPMSTTAMYLDSYLVEDFGKSYKGSGMAIHRISLYRHGQNCFATSKQFKNGVTRTSLVFGAGTLQWSWALSSWHDGYTMPVDRDLQQATLNILADMSAFPNSFCPFSNDGKAVSDVKVSAAPSLVFPAISSDIEPPHSTITLAVFINCCSSNHTTCIAMRKCATCCTTVFHIEGTARDSGGGNVAAVEVSVDGGLTWQLASGRNMWVYQQQRLKYKTQNCPGKCIETSTSKIRVQNTSDHILTHRQKQKSSVAARRLRGRTSKSKGFAASAEGITAGNHDYVCYEALQAGLGQSKNLRIVISRAVDDSGWIEQVSARSLDIFNDRTGNPQNNTDTNFAHHALSGFENAIERFVAENVIVVKGP
jgi:hypothetical protein